MSLYIKKIAGTESNYTHTFLTPSAPCPCPLISDSKHHSQDLSEICSVTIAALRGQHVALVAQIPSNVYLWVLCPQAGRTRRS